MIQEIKFNGYTASPLDYDSLDGDLEMSMGMVLANGAIRPSKSQTPIRMLFQMRVVRVHETSAYKHYITINNDGTEIGWIDGEGEFDGNWTSTATKIADVTDFVEVNSIGNTLIILSKNAITYCLWKDGAYKLLGNHIPDVELSFGLVGHPRLYSQSDPSKSTFEVVFNTPNINWATGSSLFITPTEDGVKALTSQVMAKVNKFVREQTVDKGRFCFPFLVRYALRLYDGSSLVCHSAPILMNPSTTAAPVVFWDEANSEGANSDGTYSVRVKDCDIMLMAADLDYAVIRSSVSEQLDNWKDIVKSVDVYISKPIYTYDQNGEIDSLYDADNFGAKFIGRMEAMPSTGETEIPQEDRMSKVYAEDGTSIAPVLQTLYSEWEYSTIYGLYFGYTVPKYTMHLPEFDATGVDDSIANTSSFFKLCSIPIDEIELDTRKTIELPESYLDSLLAREPMTDDYLSHDRLSATNAIVYNQRLHLSGVKRALFKGFSALSMLAYKNGLFTIEYGEGNETFLIPVWDNTPYTIRTYIKEDGVEYGVSVTDSTISDLVLSNAFDLDAASGRFVFYPNMNAYKMEISRVGIIGHSTIELQPHPYLNGAFAFIGYDDRKNTFVSDYETDTTPFERQFVPQSNKLYVSEIANPFYFPLLGIYTVGVGEIYNISSATKALSEGQFGQFPLYAFTSDGIWALQISATGSYTAVQPITRDICTNPTSITQIDGAVLFATDRGIMMISGSNTLCISETIDTDCPALLKNLPHGEDLIAKIGGNIEQYDILPFREFLRDCQMIYDYTHQRIIVFNASCKYAYEYSLESKAWGIIASALVSSVNSYPEALAMTSSGVLLDFSAEFPGTRYPSGILVSRPIKLGAADLLKTIDTIIVRGNFAKGDICGVVLYGSRDLRNWFPVYSSTDHYLRGFKGTAYKYYKVAILISVQREYKDDFSITGCTIQYTPKLMNQPR